MSNLTATEKATLTRFLEVLDYASSTSKVDLNTGKEVPHKMPLTQLMTLIEVSTKEGLQMSAYKAMGNNKGTRTKTLRALSDRRGHDAQNGFGFIILQPDPTDMKTKNVFLTDKGRDFVKGLYKELQEVVK